MRIVLTGSPSTGKSNVLKFLALEDWIVFPEALRWKAWLFSLESKLDLIKKEGLDLLSIQQYMEDTPVPEDAYICFDRCVIDLVAYQQYYGTQVPDQLLLQTAYHSAAALEYAFFTKLYAPDYEKDAIRDEDVTSSQQLESIILTTYSEYSIKLVRLPYVEESERARTISKFCKNFYPIYSRGDNIVVSALIESPKGLLLLRHSNTKDWTLPGGKVEKGEYLENGIKREIFEETGIDINKAKRIMYMRYPGIDLPNGKQLFYFHLQLKYNPQLSLNPSEHEEALWINKFSDIPLSMNNSIRNIVAEQLQEITGS